MNQLSVPTGKFNSAMLFEGAPENYTLVPPNFTLDDSFTEGTITVNIGGEINVVLVSSILPDNQ